MRTIVTFDADEVAVTRGGDPPGRSLADRMAAAFAAAGVAVGGPDDLGWGWEITTPEGITCIVGLVDDAPRVWQLVISPPRTRGLRRRSSNPAVEATLRELVLVADHEVRSLSAARDVRWYDAVTFDRDHGETWSRDPE